MDILRAGMHLSCYVTNKSQNNCSYYWTILTVDLCLSLAASNAN
jgi:hypothetical protein